MNEPPTTLPQWNANKALSPNKNLLDPHRKCVTPEPEMRKLSKSMQIVHTDLRKHKPQMN